MFAVMLYSCRSLLVQGNSTFNQDMKRILTNKGVTMLSQASFGDVAGLNATISSRLTSILGDSLPSPGSASTDGTARVVPVGGVDSASSDRGSAGAATTSEPPVSASAHTSAATAVSVPSHPSASRSVESGADRDSERVEAGISALTLGGPGPDARGRDAEFRSLRIRAAAARTARVAASAAVSEVLDVHIEEESEEHEDDSDGSEATGGAVAEVATVPFRLDELLDRMQGFIATCRECIQSHAEVRGLNDDEALQSLVLSMTTALYPMRFGWTSKCIPPDSEHALVNYWYYHSLDLALLGFMQAYPEHVLSCKG